MVGFETTDKIQTPEPDANFTPVYASARALPDGEWAVGKEVEFMYMPAGIHTITAGFRGKAINLTVQVEPYETAKVVNSSLEKLVASAPKQKPFGCVEHEEKDASVWAKGFKAKDDGVYLCAEPSELGARHVNGKIHRSWSPSFYTDADYAKAKLRGDTYFFPDGVRGSVSNPARITGVAFCVGTLTNKPAFREIDPVKAREVEMEVKAGAPFGNKNAAGLHCPEAWDTHAPGTEAYDQKASGFSAHLPGGNLPGNIVSYFIDPLPTRKGFTLRSAGHPDSQGLWQEHGTFNTHRQAMKAAAEHYDLTIGSDGGYGGDDDDINKASELAVKAGGTSEGARKGWQTRRAAYSLRAADYAEEAAQWARQAKDEDKYERALSRASAAAGNAHKAEALAELENTEEAYAAAAAAHRHASEAYKHARGKYDGEYGYSMRRHDDATKMHAERAYAMYLAGQELAAARNSANKASAPRLIRKSVDHIFEDLAVRAGHVKQYTRISKTGKPEHEDSRTPHEFNHQEANSLSAAAKAATRKVKFVKMEQAEELRRFHKEAYEAHKAAEQARPSLQQG